MHSARSPKSLVLNQDTLRLYETLLDAKNSLDEKRNISECLIKTAQLKSKIKACEDLAIQFNAVYAYQLPRRREIVNLTLGALAATTGDIAIYDLIANGKVYPVRNNTPSALHIACLLGHTELVIHLLAQYQFDANVAYTYTLPVSTKQIIHSESCIALSVAGDHYNTCKVLLLNGAQAQYLPPLRRESKCAVLLDAYEAFIQAENEYKKGDQVDPVFANGQVARACILDRDFVVEYLSALLKRINLCLHDPKVEAQYTYLPEIIFLVITLLRTNRNWDFKTFEKIQRTIVDHLLGYNADHTNNCASSKLFRSNKEKSDFLVRLGLVTNHQVQASFNTMQGGEEKVHSPKSKARLFDQQQGAAGGAAAVTGPQDKKGLGTSLPAAR